MSPRARFALSSVAVCDGTRYAATGSMEEPTGSDDDGRRPRPRDTARQLVEAARAHVAAAQHRVERARNAIQATRLLRTLRERRQRRPPETS
jgi:hypothetical protein